jgi:D-serine deaminase-like pyridoxal phosphate-dependent protein
MPSFPSLIHLLFQSQNSVSRYNIIIELAFIQVNDIMYNMPNPFDAIDKPTLLLDEAAARRNIRRIADKVRAAGSAGQPIRFRPHFKTHQSAEIGAWFRTEGVSAITVSSLDMARYFAGQGWDDITIAFPANLRQAGALAELAQRAHLELLVESVESVQRLAQAIRTPVDLWIKIDAGAHRTGLAWDQSGPAAQVAEAVRAVPNFRLRGLLTHAGQTYGARGAEEVCRRYQESVARIHGLRCALQDLGLGPLQVSVGDTPAASLCPDLGPVDELRPGNFVFYDAQQIQIGSCGWQDVAVALACPVVAKHPERGEIVVYGGAIHLSKDFLMEGDKRAYGYVSLPEGSRWGAPLPGAYVSAVSQEHGVLRLAAQDLARVQVGDLVCILPAHSCLTVTLMKRYLTLDGRWIDTLNI